jgi:hypothetical protein
MSQRKPTKREGSAGRASGNKMKKDDNVSTVIERETKLLFAPKRYVVFSKFNNIDHVHIREYNVNETEQIEFPTKKGICLTAGRLRSFLIIIDNIDERLKQRYSNTGYKTHIGAGIYATITQFHCVDLRRHWIPEGQLQVVPTKQGITLNPTQWNALKEKLRELLTIHPELENCETCFHQNQMDMYSCNECAPFGVLT